MVKPSMLLVGAIALIALLSLVQIYRTIHKLSISEIRNALSGIGKKHVLLIVLALFVGCGMFFLISEEQDDQASVLVSLNFAEASNGRDFGGTRYNMSEIISDEVIERAIQDGGFENVTVDQLSSCLSVSPLVQGDSYSEEAYHIATEFLVIFESDSFTRHLDAKNVAQMVAQAYKDIYAERYLSTYDVLLIDEDVSFDDMEYLDIVKYLDKECSKLEYYMVAMDDQNSSFRDSSGNTFNGLAQKIDLLEDVQISENLYAYIVQNRVVKDADAYIGRLEYDNILLEYERQRDYASYVTCNDAVAKYDEKMSRIVLVPTWDSDGEFYMGRTKNGVDTLSVKAQGYSQDVAADIRAMKENSSVISSLRNGSERYAGEVQEMIRQIYETMVKYSKEAWSLVQEYTETQMNQCITVTVQKVSLMNMAVVCVMAAAVFYGALVLLTVASKAKKIRLGDTATHHPAQ